MFLLKKKKKKKKKKEVTPVPVSGIWVEHALLTVFRLVASAILFVTRSESSFPVAIKAFHYLDVPWFIVLTPLLALHLRVPHLSRKLVWFNENENHFIFQFSDDGAPESNELTMSIESMVCRNFGNQVRNRDFQYVLHCVSVKEKDQIMHDL